MYVPPTAQPLTQAGNQHNQRQHLQQQQQQPQQYQPQQQQHQNQNQQQQHHHQQPPHSSYVMMGSTSTMSSIQPAPPPPITQPLPPRSSPYYTPPTFEQIPSASMGISSTTTTSSSSSSNTSTTVSINNAAPSTSSFVPLASSMSIPPSTGYVPSHHPIPSSNFQANTFQPPTSIPLTSTSAAAPASSSWTPAPSTGGYAGYPQPSQGYSSNTFSTFMSDPRAQIGMQLGSKAFQAGHEYMNENIHRYINVPHMKYYFKVTRGYVFKKIRTLLFPFRQTHWYRMAKRSESGPQHEYRPPREDLNAPDLYIPSMGFVTYVFLVNLESGVRTGFHPELLGVTSSKAFFAIFSEVVLVKLGCYLFSVQATVPVLDLVAYAGYKFVGIILTLLVRLPVLLTWFPWWVFWVALAYTSLSLAFFSLRSMRYIVIPEPGTTATLHLPQRRRRINFLAAVVGLQILSTWLLVK